MADSALVSWAASRSAAVVVAGADLGGVVVGTFEAGVSVLAMVVAVLAGATDGGLTVDQPSSEHAANSRPAVKRATRRFRATPREGMPADRLHGSGNLINLHQD
jgi:hypothetical protein